ncbi:hypothetical protein GEV33_005643 [Tenebrio molitor]|uniref:Integrase catalytic domain-containing protein n=1 Tax=Tenebrio molitor TaxID=7067 RepID=A0A8J6LF75_TENMO|nr:hypothetical protein GEV33_005643 [Tenebrio molitor]
MPESEHQQVIDDLIKERQLIQSSASRFIKFVKNFNNTNNIRNLSTRLADFRPVLDKFNKVQFEIDLKSNEEDEALRDAFESEYYDAIARAEEILEHGTMQSSSNATDIKLPTINLPNFNGSYTDWSPFYESFRSLIHENNNLEKIQKLHYLRSCLGAEARRTIDTLAVSADSYDTAWRLLKERYQNKRLIVQHHIHGLFNLPQITKPSPSSLRDLTDKLNAHLESLKSQNLEVEKWDAMIIYLIASKFDTQTKGEWETKLTSNELPSLQDMKSFLIQKCQTLESIEFATSSTPQCVHPTKPKPTEAPKRFNTASSLCIKCKESHFLHQCPEFLQLNPNARYDDVRNFKLCVNCLKRGHDAKACQSRACKTCGKRHHTTLHFPKRETASGSNIEEFPDNKQLESQNICETFFRETHERTPKGRFVVKLPFKNNPPSVGPTRPMAIKQFKRLETRFAANEQLHLEYDNFLKEYLQLKHMEIVGSDELFTSAAYYLPHHPIIKQSSFTTKTRVVFNASFKAGGGELSLNDNLFTGPNLQKDIFSLLLKCRVHKILLSADITKMFRQILVHPQDRDYLRIVYRDNPNTSIKTYRLKTVTYGLNCAPFLAMLCLHELAHQFANSKPRACDAIANAFYMDDLLIGANSIEEASILRDDLINILAQGGLELCKWASNCVAVLPQSNRGGNATTVSKDVFKTVKAYVALFVCLAMKAIHLELVGDYTAESFKNCLKRMMARRGIVGNLYSDNGTNFVRTDRELKETNISWHFIPPHSPHMGGIWEAGVKSCKHHFKRIVGNALLRYEELYTLLTLIESCLNSRPITPMSNDPHDLEALTPGHFLIGAPLTAPLEPNLED